MATTNNLISGSSILVAKKLRSIGSDLGQGLKGFKKAIKDDESKDESNEKH